MVEIFYSVCVSIEVQSLYGNKLINNEKYGFLGCNVMQFRNSPIFQGNTLSLSSGKKSGEAGSLLPTSTGFLLGLLLSLKDRGSVFLHCRALQTTQQYKPGDRTLHIRCENL
jgi:hypothetical protein